VSLALYKSTYLYKMWECCSNVFNVAESEMLTT